MTICLHLSKVVVNLRNVENTLNEKEMNVRIEWMEYTGIIYAFESSGSFAQRNRAYRNILLRSIHGIHANDSCNSRPAYMFNVFPYVVLIWGVVVARMITWLRIVISFLLSLSPSLSIPSFCWMHLKVFESESSLLSHEYQTSFTVKRDR